MSTPLVTAYQRALEAGVPLLAITTPDPAMTIESLGGAAARPARQTVRRASMGHLQWRLAHGR